MSGQTWYNTDAAPVGGGLFGYPILQMRDGHYLSFLAGNIVRADGHGRRLGYHKPDSIAVLPSQFDNCVLTRDFRLAWLGGKNGLIMMDTLGNFIWKAVLDTTGPILDPVPTTAAFDEKYTQLKEDNDGNLVVFGVTQYQAVPTKSVIFGMKVSPSGTVLSTLALRAGVRTSTVVWNAEQSTTGDKSWMLTIHDYAILSPSDSLRVITIDSDLVAKTSDSYVNLTVGDSLVHLYSSLRLPGGDLLSCGLLRTITGSLDTFPVITRISPAGVPLMKKIFPSLPGFRLQSMALDSLGDVILGGTCAQNPLGVKPGLVMKVDTTTWSPVWIQTLKDEELFTAHNVFNLKVDHENYVLGYLQTAGTSTSFFRIGSDGSLGATVQGSVFHDLDADCVKDATEPALAGWRIELYGVSKPDTAYTFAEPDGSFIAHVDTGTYKVVAVSMGTTWQTSPCGTDTLLLDATAEGSIHNLFFPKVPLEPCPEMWVDLSTPLLQVCQPSTYSVLYCNVGATATASTIEIEFDTALTVTGATVPFTALPGNRISVAVGTMAPGACDSFQVFTTLDCSGVLIGETHCATATIQPDTFCLPPSPLWDGSSIQLTSRCDPDSVRFFIENVGTAAMTTGQPLIIVEDDVLRLSDIIILPAGGKDSIAQPRNGSTWSCMMEQVPFHPGISRPSTFQEGCTDTPGSFSVGYALSVPPDDGNLFIDIDCQANEPPPVLRMKTALPTGWDSLHHYISNDYTLEYHIRYRNLGPDSIFSMYIVDTLPAEVDISTLEPGSSTFPYEVQLTPYMGRHLLTFDMDRIALPDTADDPVGSWGYLKFRVNPLPGLDSGTVIENRATVVMHKRQHGATNVYFHTIGGEKEVKYLDSLTSIGYQPRPGYGGVQIYPNPGSGRATLVLGEMDFPEVEYVLTDMQGAVLHTRRLAMARELELDHADLPPGMYLIRVTSRRELLGTGKMVILR